MVGHLEPSPLYDGAPLRLIRTSDLYGELAVVALTCGTDEMPVPLPTEEEWCELIPALLPQDIHDVGNKAWLRQHPKRRRAALGMAASSLCRTLDKVRDFDAAMRQWRLAPHDRRERMMRILLQSELPPVWEGTSEENR